MNVSLKRISRYPVPDIADVPEDLRARMLEVQQKAGFVPNVSLTLAHRPERPGSTHSSQMRFSEADGRPITLFGEQFAHTGPD
jgi:hypothetical protein